MPIKKKKKVITVNNPILKKKYGNIVFGDKDTDSNYLNVYDVDNLIKLQGFNPKTTHEPNTPEEIKLDNVIGRWTNDVDNSAADYLLTLSKQLPALKKAYPKIFDTQLQNKTLLYRGLTRIGSKAQASLAKNTVLLDWQSTKDGYFLCKKPIIYNIDRKIQSWTPAKRVAENFAEEGLLLTKGIQTEFGFNPKVFKMFYGSDEQEILHFGSIYKSKVYIAVRDDFFEQELRRRLKGGKSNINSIDVFAKSIKEETMKNKTLFEILLEHLDEVQTEKVSDVDFEPIVNLLHRAADEIGLKWENVMQADIQIRADSDFRVFNIPKQSIDWFEVSLEPGEKQHRIVIPDSADIYMPVID